MGFANLGNKKYEYEDRITWETNVENGNNYFKFEKYEDLINRLFDLQILVAQELEKWKDVVKVSIDMNTKELKFYFYEKDADADLIVTLILDGLNLRFQKKEFINKEFFKSKAYNLLEEENAITQFLLWDINKEWKQKFLDLKS